MIDGMDVWESGRPKNNARPCLPPLERNPIPIEPKVIVTVLCDARAGIPPGWTAKL
jgi:hypothetical protein